MKLPVFLIALLAAFAGIMAFDCDAAQAITVQPGQTLQVKFTMSGPSHVPGHVGAGGGILDVLEFGEGDGGTFGTATARLFDGTTLLSSVTFATGFFRAFTFTAPGSSFTFGPIGQFSDWSSLIDGTIDGILKITFSTAINTTISITDLGIGNGTAGTLSATTQPQIVSVSVTPIPASLPLFITGAGMIGMLGWRRKRRSIAA